MASIHSIAGTDHLISRAHYDRMTGALDQIEYAGELFSAAAKALKAGDLIGAGDSAGVHTAELYAEVRGPALGLTQTAKATLKRVRLAFDVVGYAGDEVLLDLQAKLFRLISMTILADAALAAEKLICGEHVCVLPVADQLEALADACKRDQGVHGEIDRALESLRAAGRFEPLN